MIPPGYIPALEVIVYVNQVAYERDLKLTNRRRNEEMQCIERQRGELKNTQLQKKKGPAECEGGELDAQVLL